MIAAIIRLVVRRWENRTGGLWHLFGGPSAMEILRQRYARGQIDAATFDEMRARLEEGADVGQRQPTTF